jgi:hypothetical protein
VEINFSQVNGIIQDLCRQWRARRREILCFAGSKFTNRPFILLIHHKLPQSSCCYSSCVPHNWMRVNFLSGHVIMVMSFQVSCDTAPAALNNFHLIMSAKVLHLFVSLFLPGEHFRHSFSLVLVPSSKIHFYGFLIRS